MSVELQITVTGSNVEDLRSQLESAADTLGVKAQQPEAPSDVIEPVDLTAPAAVAPVDPSEPTSTPAPAEPAPANPQTPPWSAS